MTFQDPGVWRRAKVRKVAEAEDLAMAGDRSGAAAAARQALDLDPEDGELAFLWGYYLALAGRPQDAIAPIEAAIEALGDHGDAERHLADCLREVGRFEEAVGHYRKALGLLGDDPDLLAALRSCDVALRSARAAEPPGPTEPDLPPPDLAMPDVTLEAAFALPQELAADLPPALPFPLDLPGFEEAPPST